MHLHHVLFYHTSYCIHYFKKCPVYRQAKLPQCKIFILHTGKNVFPPPPLALKLCKTDMGKKKKKQLARLLSELIASKCGVGEEPAQNPWSGKKGRDNAAMARTWGWKKALRGQNNWGGEGNEKCLIEGCWLATGTVQVTKKRCVRQARNCQRGVLQMPLQNTPGDPARDAVCAASHIDKFRLNLKESLYSAEEWSFLNFMAQRGWSVRSFQLRSPGFLSEICLGGVGPW